MLHCSSQQSIFFTHKISFIDCAVRVHGCFCDVYGAVLSLAAIIFF